MACGRRYARRGKATRSPPRSSRATRRAREAGSARPGSPWAIERAGAPAVVQWIAANDPAASLTAIKTGGQLAALLDRLARSARRSVRRSSTLFVAATAPEDRQRLYEIRFGTRAAGAFDWMAGGEGLWNQQGRLTATGGTAPPSPRRWPPAARRTSPRPPRRRPKSPLVELRDELDDVYRRRGSVLDADRQAHHR